MTRPSNFVSIFYSDWVQVGTCSLVIHDHAMATVGTQYVSQCYSCLLDYWVPITYFGMAPRIHRQVRNVVILCPGQSCT